MAPFQILRAFRLLAILWIAVGCVSEKTSDGHGMRVATVGFPTIYQGAATLRTSRTNRFTYTVAGMIDHVDTVDSSGTLRTTYYKYDDARRRRQADSPEGVLTWQRDAQGNIIAMQGYRRSAVTTNAEVTGGTNTSPVVQIDYDAFGNRVKKTAGGTTTWYLVDDQSPSGYQQVVAEFNSLTSAPLRTYAYGLSLIDIVGGGTTSYALTDGQGSVRALFSDNASASITDNYDFDAYGVLTASTGSTVNNYRYTGQQWDPDLQLYYLRARYYAPTLGRFWSSDSFEGTFNDPVSLHKYLYCRSTPIQSVDPSPT